MAFAPFSAFKRGWMRFVHRLGEVQTTILLTLIYVLMIGPLSVSLRVLGRGDLLELKGPRDGTFAHPKLQIPTDAERCERPF